MVEKELEELDARWTRMLGEIRARKARFRINSTVASDVLDYLREIRRTREVLRAVLNFDKEETGLYELPQELIDQAKAIIDGRSIARSATR